MKYAIIDGGLKKAFPKGKANCQYCNRQMVAKCGKIIIWHWAHSPRYKCDPWWENETEWHRKWKNYFPEEFQEVIHFDDSGEKHIADIKTKKGLVIELQHSSMPIEEMKSRENFYKKMIWIVDGVPFKNNFHILSKLPPPESELVRKLKLFRKPRYPLTPGTPGYKITNRPIFFLDDHIIDEGENYIGYNAMVISSNPKENFDASMDTQLAIENAYSGDHFLDWRRPRKIWLTATMPVYFDFGGNQLWLIRRFQTFDWSVKAIDKKFFLENILK